MDKVVQVYVKALFDSCSGKESDINSQLQSLAEAFSSKEVLGFFSNPMESAQQKQNVIKSVFNGKVAEQLLSFLEVLSAKNRISLLPQLAQQFNNLIQSKSNIASGKVVSAHPVDPSLQQALVQAFEKASNKKVHLTFEVKKDLVAGLSAHIDGLSYVDTTANHLDRLKEELNRGV